MSEAKTATNGAVASETSPNILVRVQEIKGEWFVELAVRVPSGVMEKAVKCATYDDVLASVPILLKQVKEQFYA
jgi:hypothetical protein